MKKMYSFCKKLTEENLILLSRAESYLEHASAELPVKNYVKSSNFFKQALYFKPFVEGFYVLGILTDDEPIFLLYFKYGARSGDNEPLQGFHQVRPNTILKGAFRNMLDSRTLLKSYSVKCVCFKLKFSGFLEDINSVRDCAGYTTVIDCLELLDLMRTKPHVLQSVKLELDPLFMLSKNSGSYLHTGTFQRLDFEKMLTARLDGIKKIFVVTGARFYELDLELFFKINPFVVFVSFVRPIPDSTCTEVELCTRDLKTFTCTVDTELVVSRLYLGAHVKIVLEGDLARVVWKTLGTRAQLTHISRVSTNKIVARLQN